MLLGAERPALALDAAADALAAKPLLVNRDGRAPHSRAGEMEAALAGVADDDVAAVLGLAAGCAGRGTGGGGEAGGASGRRRGVVVVGADDVEGIGEGFSGGGDLIEIDAEDGATGLGGGGGGGRRPRVSEFVAA